MTEYVVCCTAKGQHGRVTWPKLIREGDVVREHLVRRAKAPWPTGSRIEAEGEVSYLGASYLTHAESARVEHPTDELWRWKCPKCSRDRPLNGQHLRAWMDATDGVLLDISMLPR